MTEKVKGSLTRLEKRNTELSTKLTALLYMFESYYTDYHQNKLELIDVISSDIKEVNSSDLNSIKHINRTIKNKTNRLNNKIARVDKFKSEFYEDFTEVFGEKKELLKETVLDTFEEFWSNNITITDNKLIIK